MVLAFDRSLATKADRFNIAETKKWCEDTFISQRQKRELDSSIAGMTASVKEKLGTFKERLDSLEEGLRERTV